VLDLKCLTLIKKNNNFKNIKTMHKAKIKLNYKIKIGGYNYVI